NEYDLYMWASWIPVLKTNINWVANMVEFELPIATWFHTKFLNEQDQKALKILDEKIHKFNFQGNFILICKVTLNGIRLEINEVQDTRMDIVSTINRGLKR
ncbi:39970_t:CDS:2, partial [Gigaspora margarita]